MNCKTKIEIIDNTGKVHRTSLLSYTSAMSAWSFSLPALQTCPFSRYDDPSYICSSCYALLGRYTMPNVLNAQWIRYIWIKENLENNPREVVNTLTESIGLHS